MKGVQYFSELTHRNGCLNQKLSIDADGYICNCPSMKEKYGHISNTALKEVVSLPSFIAKWHIKKDDIHICKDCEYRYICSDCRAYTIDEGNVYSKPAKCLYDPYTGQWEKGAI